jgi:uncharacterized protein GlcG (DUF336 family)
MASDPSRAPPFASLPGQPGFLIPYSAGTVSGGTAFGTPASGVVPTSVSPDAPWKLIDGQGFDRFPTQGSGIIQLPLPTFEELTQAEVESLLQEAYSIARRARGQIRRPLGSSAEVSITVVDSNGNVLGLIRTPDAPIFGIDVAVQKARTAAFFTSGGAASIPQVAAAASFVAPGNFSGSTAWSARAIGNLHRPTFPDGIEGTPPGPFSTPMSSWSPFNVGLQEDLVLTQIVNALGVDVSKGCVSRIANAPPPLGTPFPEIANGIQIFPGAVPIYRKGGGFLGAIGVSGDGVDQDDMVSFLAVANVAARSGASILNAPAAMRSDQLTPMGTRLRYVQCPQSPFNGSTEQNVCAGL